MNRSVIAGSYGGSIFTVLRNLYTVFHSGCANLQYYQQCPGVPIFPHPCQYLLFVIFLLIAILIDGRSYLTVVLICISLMISDSEKFFTCQLTIFMFSFEKNISMLLAHFSLLTFLSCMSSLHILDINLILHI